MARTMTAEDVVADIRRRANLEYSDLLTDAEILEWFNQELTELRGHLRLSEGQVHEWSTATINVTNLASNYPLPSDFWELLGVTVNINGQTLALEPFMENERADLLNGPYLSSFASPMYRLSGTTIDFLPQNQIYTATIRYVPANGRLRLGQTPPDTLDGYNGYELAPIYGTVALCQVKEDADPGFYEQRKMMIYKRIDALAAQRDASRPERVTDVVGLDNAISPFGFNGW